MPKILTNPFFVYIFSFLIVVLVYSLGWSSLYPDLSSLVLFFFLFTFAASFMLGLFIDHHKRISFQKIRISEKRFLLTICILAGYFAEFFYNKGIPLLIILKGNGDYNYQLFGIPVFHVLLVTFNSFFAVWLFHQLISVYSRTGLLLFIINLVPSLLIMNRGMLLMILTSCLFLYLTSLKRIRPVAIAWMVIGLVVVFYFFGVLGNLRQTGRWQSDYITHHGKSTSRFEDSFVPRPYFWTYLYISSPLANFQTAVTRNNDRTEQWGSFLNYELLPDFISKRIGSMARIEKPQGPRVADWLSVSTFYTGSFVAVGWFGPVLMFVFFALTTIVYLFLITKGSPFYGTALAILNTVVLFCTFDNMYAFTGLSLQLAYPLIFSFLGKQRSQAKDPVYGKHAG